MVLLILSIYCEEESGWVAGGFIIGILVWDIG
jgi:hypothetical protein